MTTAINYFNRPEVACSFTMQRAFAGQSSQVLIIRSILRGQLRHLAPYGGLMVNLGCGTGCDIPYFKHEFSLKKVHAIDSSEIMIDFLKSLSLCNGVSTQVANLLTDRFDVEDGAASLVISTSTTPYLENMENFFSESSRILKRTGILAFDSILHSEASRETIKVLDSESDVNSYFYSFENILNLAKRNNMTLLAQVQMGYDRPGPKAEHNVIFLIRN